MNKLSLAVQCSNCGKWRATETTNLNSAQFTCFDCGKTMKLRNSKGWNVNYRLPIGNQQVDYLVRVLNTRDQ